MRFGDVSRSFSHATFANYLKQPNHRKDMERINHPQIETVTRSKTVCDAFDNVLIWCDGFTMGSEE